MNATKTVEEKSEQFSKSPSMLTPRTSEIFMTNFGSNITMTQHSIGSPGP